MQETKLDMRACALVSRAYGLMPAAAQVRECAASSSPAVLAELLVEMERLVMVVGDAVGAAVEPARSLVGNVMADTVTRAGVTLFDVQPVFRAASTRLYVVDAPGAGSLEKLLAAAGRTPVARESARGIDLNALAAEVAAMPMRELLRWLGRARFVCAGTEAVASALWTDVARRDGAAASALAEIGEGLLRARKLLPR
ncbi:MAG TPA: hypothetical protein VK506_12250 [Conexibacter sp.]|nr:hypothetical protein [Conexibacter sp.]